MTARAPTCMTRAMILSLTVACGGADPLPDAPAEESGPNCTIEGSERFLPLVEGAQWTHDTIKLQTDVRTAKTQVVGALQDMGGSKAGVMAFPLTTSKDNGQTTNWQQDTGTAVFATAKTTAPATRFAMMTTSISKGASMSLRRTSSRERPTAIPTP